MVDDLGGCDTRAMARRAIIGVYPQVAKGYARKGRKVVGNVTRRAIQHCRHMIVRLAKTDPAVMASRAVVNIYARVIERRISEVRRVMARDAIGCGGQVIKELADGDQIVMAGLAVIDDIGVIIDTRRKIAGRVTKTAIVGRRHVVV
jgi:hypothetical protein